MENGLKRISEFFSGRKIFSVPDYQRAYAWEPEKHLSDFTEDIMNIKPGRDYFLGTILLQDGNIKKDGNEIIDIVDGQQRITTIAIYMTVLINELKKHAAPDSDILETLSETYIKYKKCYKINTQDDDNDFFHTYILDSNDGEKYIKTPSQRRLYEAKKFFASNLSTYSYDILDSLRTKIDENTKVLTYSVKNTAEATLIFETTNDRGKRLTNLEKVKSFLMYKLYLATDDNDNVLHNIIKKRFTEIYREIEAIDVKLDEDSILQYHYIAFEKWSDKERYQNNVRSIKIKINHYINRSRDKAAIDFIDKYTKELRETFVIVNKILSDKSESVRDIFLLERVGNFWPLLIKTYKHDQSESKENFLRIARLLEIFSFRVYAINQCRANAGQSTIYGLARDFRGDYSELESNLINNIKYYCDNRAFKVAISDPLLYNNISGRDISYFFWKYENHLRITQQPIGPKLSEQEFKNDDSKYCFTIEHIACQNPTIITDKKKLPNITTKFNDNYLHSIGNLTIDPKSANSSKSNKVFKTKNSEYFVRAPYKTHNELDTFIVNRKWSEKSILKRREKLVHFALTYWDSCLAELD